MSTNVNGCHYEEDRGKGHDCGGEPTERLAQPAAGLPTHHLAIGSQQGDEDQERRRDQPIDHGCSEQRLDWINAEEVHGQSTEHPQSKDAIEERAVPWLIRQTTSDPKELLHRIGARGGEYRDRQQSRADDAEREQNKGRGTSNLLECLSSI